MSFGFNSYSIGTMGGQKLPFDVDPDLEKDMAAYAAEGDSTEKDSRKAFLFPPYPGGVPKAPPVTPAERRRVQLGRELRARKHASDRYTGPKGTLAALDAQSKKRSLAEFNAFEDQPTYSKRHQPKQFQLPDVRKVKFAAPYLFPKEIQEHIGYDPNAHPDDPKAMHNRKLGLKMTVADKLARFDEDADEETGVDDAGDDDDGEGKDDDGEGGDDDAPQDDDFEEDEDDDGNDYNAEQYFDDGEEDFEEAGGDEYAGDDGDYAAEYEERQREKKNDHKYRWQRAQQESELERRAW